MRKEIEKKPTRITYTFLLVVCTTAISACSGSSSNSDNNTVESITDELEVVGAPIEVDTALITAAIAELPADAESGGAGLVVETTGDCTAAGETVTLALFARDADVGIAPEMNSSQTANNVTAYTEFTLDADSANSAVDVVSHTDTQLDLTINTPDIVSISASFASNSVTDFIAAWPVDAPESAVLIAERDNGVCLYSMRLPGFCGTTRSTGVASQMSFGDQVLEFSACELIQTPDLPLIRL